MARLLLDRGADVMQATKTGITALHVAAGRGHEEMLRAPWLGNAGGEAEEVDSEHGSNSLGW